MEEPGRNLRNLGEPWEPLRSRTGTGTATAPARRRRIGPGRARTGWGGRTCTDPGRDVYVPPPTPRSKVGESPRRSSERVRLGRRETGREIPRKSRGVYAGITDFSLQYQRSEKTGTELGTACRCRCRCRTPLARCGEGHTNGRDRRCQPGAVAHHACSRPPAAPAAATARERPSSRACHGASRSLRRLARRCAPRRGRLGDA